RLVRTGPGRAMRFRVPPLPPRRAPDRPPNMAGVGTERSPHMASVGTDASAGCSPKTAKRSPKTARTVAKYGHPSSPDPPIVFPSAESSAVNSSVEGSQRARIDDQDFSDNGEHARPAAQARETPPEAERGICPECRHAADVTDDGKIAPTPTANMCGGWGRPALATVNP